MSKLDIAGLEDFLAVAKTRSITVAAQQRGMAQSAMSRHITSLENWVGAPLVERGRTPLELTPDGHTFMSVTADILTELYQLRDQIARNNISQNECLTISALHAISIGFIPRWLAELNALSPSFDPPPLLTMTGNLPECAEALAFGSVDFMITYDNDKVPAVHETSDYVSLVLDRELLVPVCKQGKERELAKSLLSGAKGVPYLAYSRGAYLYNVTQRMIEDTRIGKRLKLVHQSAVAEALKSLAREGFGIAWVPESAVRYAVDGGSLARLDLVDGLDFPVELTPTLIVRLFRKRGSGTPLVEQLWLFAGQLCQQKARDGHLAAPPARRTRGRPRKT